MTDLQSRILTTSTFKHVSPYLSVVIPSYNRTDALRRTLCAYESLCADRDDVELIVSDDGSTETHTEVLCELAESMQLPLMIILNKSNRGPAHARNEALQRVRGRVVLITGDDVEPTAAMLTHHRQWHLDHDAEQEALLGRVTWPPDMSISPFMRWLEDGGRKFFFNYKDLPTDRPISGMYFYTCNVSVKQSLLKREVFFDTTFPYASHEDLDLGVRLEQYGMSLWYDPEALGYHWHPLTCGGVLRRIYIMGHSAVTFWEKHGSAAGRQRRCLRGWLQLLAGTRLSGAFIQHNMRICSDGKPHPWRWWILLNMLFWSGANDARRAVAVEKGWVRFER